MQIKVNVKFFGVLRKSAGKEKVEVILKQPANIKNLIQELIEKFPKEFGENLIDAELKDPRPNALILINNREINVLNGLETSLKEGDEIIFIPVTHGG